MELYPEEKPKEVKPVETFVFSTAAISHSKEDTNLQIEALETRINKLVDKYGLTVNGHPFPVIEHILKISHDETELVGVGRALERVASLIGQLDELHDQRRAIELAEEKPEWFAWAFADLSSDVEHGISGILNTNSSTIDED